jgi:hypothetical protein
MPRQPLPINRRRSAYSIASLGMERRPEIASLIGQCLMHWSNIELQMALLLGVFLNATNEAAVAVYLSLRAGRVRQDALNAAANAVLSGEVFELYRAIVDFHTSVETQRNDLAHGCFGVMDDIPEAVLWMEPRHVADFMLNFWNKIEHSTPTGPPIPTSQQERDQIQQKHVNRMFVYGTKDIEKLLIDIERLWRTLGSFIYFLRNSRATEIYQKLVNEPHVKAALANIRARESSP